MISWTMHREEEKQNCVVSVGSIFAYINSNKEILCEIYILYLHTCIVISPLERISADLKWNYKINIVKIVMHTHTVWKDMLKFCQSSVS